MKGLNDGTKFDRKRGLQGQLLVSYAWNLHWRVCARTNRSNAWELLRVNIEKKTAYYGHSSRMFFMLDYSDLCNFGSISTSLNIEKYHPNETHWVVEK